MDPKKRRQMLVQAGLADPIPSLGTRRSWEYIDDRIPPAGDADGEFTSFQTWVNKAASWIGYTGARCYDAKDRICRRGKDFAIARDEDAFPVRWYLPNRYPSPVIPTVQTMRVRSAVALAGSAGILQEELRKRQGMSSITGKMIEAALEGRAELVDGRWTMSPDGIEQTKFEMDQVQRASWVRA